MYAKLKVSSSLSVKYVNLVSFFISLYNLYFILNFKPRKSVRCVETTTDVNQNLENVILREEGLWIAAQRQGVEAFRNDLRVSEYKPITCKNTRSPVLQ